jgi:hypothetical protein
MKDKRKPVGTVRRLTKGEANTRAMKALQQRNEAINERTHVVKRLMEAELMLAVLVARVGRVRISEDELVAEYTDMVVRKDESGLVLECAIAGAPAAEPGEALGALLQGGFTVVEDIKGEGGER